MARRKRSLSSSGSSSSSSSSQSDSSSSDSDSAVEQEKKNTKEENNVKKRGRDESRPKAKDKVNEKAKKLHQARSSPRRSRISDNKSSKSESRNNRKSDKSNTDDKSSNTKHNKSPERPHKQKPKRERSPKAEKKKMLFPIVSKEDSVSIEQETGKKPNIVTETNLVSYPNLNSSITAESNRRLRGEEDRKRRHTSGSPERFKSMSSMITVKHNPEAEKRPRRSPAARNPAARNPAPRSLRDRVGWDPFQGTTAVKYGDHDDRQLNRGYNDSYTRKDFGRGRGRGRGGGGGGPRTGFRSDNRQQRTGGLWSNNRNFNRSSDHEAVDRSGINDKKWKRDLYSDE